MDALDATSAPAGHDCDHPTSWIVRAVRWYQRGMEGRPSPCRFYPSCSAYAIEAVEVHGSVRGSIFAVRRLLRCRPFGPSGFDPVPEPVSRPSRSAHRAAAPRRQEA